ncbi:hypothetical protein tinsulaeT_38440 [Thalassotalea insulae]|uniref:Extracellular solute-binding protein n=1 Tax=Thalassotalea insulae TaxID=2056778 RepID=A0ABQ6GXW3_9GAMM|nr:extracellular solute-binding protein [Thalassotalea insulae]GLX80504.1 hypothetical protein tinsulaeT_38440 [Thalassotalea insulae]
MIRLLLCLLLFAVPAFCSPVIKFVFTYEGKRFEHIIDIFSKQENIEIERLWANQGDLKVNLLAYIEKGNAPDVVMIPADHIGLHQLMHYSVIPENYQSSAISNELWQSVKSDGQIYGIPVIQGNHLVLYYNKRYIDKPATSWQEIKQQKSEFSTKKQVKQNTRFIAWNYQEMYWFSPFFNAYSGDVITANGQLSLDSPAMINALNYYKQFADDNLVDKNCDYQCARQLFLDGKLAYTINGDWAFKEYQATLGDNLGIAQLPAIAPETPLVSYFSTHVLAFPNNSLTGPKKVILQKLVNFIQQQVAQEQIWLSMKVFPVHQAVFNRIKNSQSPLVQELVTGLSHAQLMSSDSTMSYAWSALRKGFLRHQAGVMNAEQSAQLMQRIATNNQRKNQ